MPNPEDKTSYPKLRLIPRLDIKGTNLVKGIHLEGLRVLGDPARFARAYYEDGADELLYIDVVASLYGRNSLLEYVERAAREIFIPLTVGGGLRSVEDIRAALRAGADKVAINTAAVRRPEFIREGARRFGSSSIVLSIEAIQRPDGSYEAYTDNGREKTGLEVRDWAARGVELGAGEILLTSIDREGTGLGFDVELLRSVANAVPVPVIACGGAACAGHVREAAVEGQVQAVAIASMLHYAELGKTDGACIGGLDQHLMRSATVSNNFQNAGLQALKKELNENGVPCRPALGQEVA